MSGLLVVVKGRVRWAVRTCVRMAYKMADVSANINFVLTCKLYFVSNALQTIHILSFHHNNRVTNCHDYSNDLAQRLLWTTRSPYMFQYTALYPKDVLVYTLFIQFVKISNIIEDYLIFIYVKVIVTNIWFPVGLAIFENSRHFGSTCMSTGLIKTPFSQLVLNTCFELTRFGEISTVVIASRPFG